MPLDATNMPFRRSAAFENKDSSFSESAGTRWDTTLKAESILLEEFNYVSVTAYQLKEGRANLFNIYLIIIGITATALGTIATLYPSLQPVLGSLSRGLCKYLFPASLELRFLHTGALPSFQSSIGASACCSLSLNSRA